MLLKNRFQITVLSLLFAWGAAGAQSAGPMPSAALDARGLETVDFPRMRELEDDVYIYEGLHSPIPDGTVFNTVSLIVVTSDGVLVVDGQEDIWQTKLMLEYVKKVTDQPVTRVVVASEHGDHTGGNAAFRAAYPDVEFIASPASQRALADTATPPTRAVAEKYAFRMGSTEVEVLNLGRAHTGGDLAVYLPQSKVLFLSEIYLRGLFPALRTGYASEWVAAIENAQAMDASWLVPGHGFIDDQAAMERDLELLKQSLIAVIAESKRLYAAGVPCESVRDCPAAEQADWGAYAGLATSEFLTPFAINRVYQELEGTLK